MVNGVLVCRKYNKKLPITPSLKADDLPIASSTLSEGWRIFTLNEHRDFFVLFCLKLDSLEAETECRIQEHTKI